VKKFMLGVAFTLGVLVLGGGIVAGLGLIDTSAELQPGKLEQYVASMALEASVKRSSGNLVNPLPASDANLLEGMTLYVMNCTGCHGTLDGSPSILGRNFYPPAPDLILNPLDDPEWYTYHVIKHGVRWTGMPAWNKRLKDEELWKLTAFLSRINKLPPAVQEKMPKPAASR
jgi:mono/diheme cytochrome c family protein